MKILSFKGGKDRNLSYLIYDSISKKALVIDPFEDISIYEKKAEELKVKILGVINTHYHKDHIEGNNAFIEKGIQVLDLTNKKKVKIGKNEINIIKTPGHTPDCICFLINDNLFTGDVLLVNRVGFSHIGPETKQLYESLQKLKTLPHNTKIYPGHYYNSKFPSTIEKEKTNNQYLTAKNLEDFETLVDKWREHIGKYIENIKNKSEKK